MEKIIIGKISKPQGIRGEVKVYPLTDSISRFEGLTEVYIGEEPNARKVRGVRTGGNDVFMYIDGVLTRNDAEKLRDKYISVERSKAVKPEKGRYFISDLIGCKIYNENGNYIGVVRDVLLNGAADIFSVNDGKKDFMFPFVNGVVLEINTAGKKITVSQKRFSEVACYED